MSISVVTVCRNSTGVIADCLTSVRRQTEPFEHVIVDGASCDGTAESCRQFIERTPPAEANRFVLISEPDAGIYDAMNKGIRRSTGDVIGMLNADDSYADDHVLARVARAFENREVEACYGDLVYVRQEGAEEEDSERVVRYWKAGGYRRSALYRGWMPPHPTFFVRRRLYDEFGLYRLDLGTAADYELMLRFLLRYRVTCAYVPAVQVRMRIGGVSSSSFSNRLSAHRNDRQAWRVNDLKPHLWTLPLKPLRKAVQWVRRPPLV